MPGPPRRRPRLPRLPRIPWLPWLPAPAALPAAAVLAALVAAGAFAALVAYGAWRLSRGTAAGEAAAPPPPRLSVAASLGGADARGFARALAPRPFVFPADHGPHPDFRTEWWYYTGNLAARGGRRFGFQLTFFRVALAPAPPDRQGADVERSSAWATRQVWFAHFAVTDAASGRFLAYERWERQALGLAGARSSPFRVWVGDWSAAAVPVTNVAAAATAGLGTQPGRTSAVAGTPPTRLLAEAATAAGSTDARGGGVADADHPDAGVGIDLTLRTDLPPVPEGDHGLSPKSAEPGNASYYYSLPRLAAAGTVRLGGERMPVSGLAWMDREWSTSALGPGEVGWDWFALQLDDGWELMLYRLRRRPSPPAVGPTLSARAGSMAPVGTAAGASTASAAAIDPVSLATWIAPGGTTERLPLAALSFTETGHWTSPATRTRYPSGWRLTLPGGGPAACDLTVRPLVTDQELRLSLRYWEGAVVATGTHNGKPVTARGYVELTGYGDAPGPAGNNGPPP